MTRPVPNRTGEPSSPPRVSASSVLISAGNNSTSRSHSAGPSPRGGQRPLPGAKLACGHLGQAVSLSRGSTGDPGPSAFRRRTGRILIARLMLQPADILLLDEPTNDLDIPSLDVLEEGLTEFPGALVLVTHDRFLLDRVCNQVLVLMDGARSNTLPTMNSGWPCSRSRNAKTTESDPRRLSRKNQPCNPGPENSPTWTSGNTTRWRKDPGS